MSEVDEISASLQYRNRLQQANHVRPLAAQTLDALLRIEELLTELVEAKRNDSAKAYKPEPVEAPAKPKASPAKKSRFL